MTRFDDHDRAFMTRALELAERGLYTTTPNPRVGCVLVRDGRIIGEGWHQRAGGLTPKFRTWPMLPRAAQIRAAQPSTSHWNRQPPGPERLPAPSALPPPAWRRWSPRCPIRIRRQRTAPSGRAAGIEVDIGLLGGPCREINLGWLMKVEHGRPWVRVKIAASLDGRTAPRTAPANGSPAKRRVPTAIAGGRGHARS
jgi:diaminohydroxyphosphoribosylaminopyrimidine deaminase/5-amino-6-(5-phosphoribosylamino)uracil reductase